MTQTAEGQGQDPQSEQARAEAMVKSSEELRDQLILAAVKAENVRGDIERQQEKSGMVTLAEDRTNPNSLSEPKGIAKASQKAVQMVLYGVKHASKIASAVLEQPDPVLQQEASDFTRSVLTELASKINPDDVSIYAAPYLHRLLAGLYTGKIYNVEQIIKEYKVLHPGLAKAGAGIAPKFTEAIAEVVQKKKGLSSRELALEELGDIKKEQDPNRLMSDAEKKGIKDKSGELGRAHEKIDQYLRRIETVLTAKFDPTKPGSDRYLPDRIKNFLLQGEDDEGFGTNGDPLTLESVKKILTSDAGMSPSEVNDLFNNLMMYKNLSADVSLRREDLYPEVMATLGTWNELSMSQRLFDSTGRWNMHGAKQYEREVLRVTGELFRDLDPATPFQEQFSDFAQGQVFRTIKSKMRELSKDRDSVLAGVRKRLIDQGTSDADLAKEMSLVKSNYDNLFRTLVYKINLEFSWQRLAHELNNLLKNASPDQWKQLIARMKPLTEMAIQLEDPVLEYAVPYLISKVQDDIVRSGNELPKDLNVSQYTNDGDSERIKAIQSPRREEFNRWFKDMVADLKDRGIIDRDVEDWEVNRARLFADAINNFITMRAPAVMSNANVAKHYAGVPFGDLMAILNGEWRWDMMRGRVGITNDPEAYALKIETSEMAARKAAGKLWEGRRNIDPEAVQALGIAEFVDEVGTDSPEVQEALKEDFINHILGVAGKEAGAIDKRIDDYILERTKMLWGNRIRGLSMGNWIDRGGWRTNDGLERYYDEVIEKYPKPRPTFAEWVKQRVGVGGMYFTLDGRLANDSDSYLVEMVEGVEPKNQGGMDYIKGKLVGDYSTGDNRLDTIMKVRIDGGSEEISYNEYKTRRKRALRGEVFYEAVQRDPMGFINTLSQTFPQLTENTVTYKKRGTGEEVKISAADYYFNIQQYPDESMSPDDINKRAKFRKELHELFGVHNWKHIRELMLFNNRVRTATFYDENGNEVHGDGGREKLFKSLNLARETAHTRERRFHEDPQAFPNETGKDLGIIRPEDIVTEAEIDRLKQESEKQDLTPEKRVEAIRRYNEARNRWKIRELMFSQNDGFITYMTGIVGRTDKDRENYFGNGRDNLGKREDFFQMCAFAYHEEKAIPLLPNFYMDLAVMTARAENDDAPVGSIGDLNVMKEVQDLAFGLPGKLGEVAQSGDMDKLFEYQAELYGKLTIIDENWAKELTRDMCEVIAQWFEEVDGDKIFPINFLQKFRKGDKLSISKLKYGPSAYSWSGDEQNAYYRKLKEAGFLAPEYFEHLLKSRQVELPRLIMTQILPNILIGLVVFLLYQYTKEAYEQNVDEPGGGD